MCVDGGSSKLLAVQVGGCTEVRRPRDWPPVFVIVIVSVLVTVLVIVIGIVIVNVIAIVIVIVITGLVAKIYS